MNWPSYIGALTLTQAISCSSNHDGRRGEREPAPDRGAVTGSGLARIPAFATFPSWAADVC